jgi:hypothetical protein
MKYPTIVVYHKLIKSFFPLIFPLWSVQNSRECNFPSAIYHARVATLIKKFISQRGRVTLRHERSWSYILRVRVADNAIFRVRAVWQLLYICMPPWRARIFADVQQRSCDISLINWKERPDNCGTHLTGSWASYQEETDIREACASSAPEIRPGAKRLNICVCECFTGCTGFAFLLLHVP